MRCIQGLPGSNKLLFSNHPLERFWERVHLITFWAETRYSSTPVTVYVSKGCGDPCKLGLDYLKKRGVPYTQKVVSTQKDIDQLTKLAGARKVPVLVVGIDVQAGYAEQGWSDALDSAGYPKAGAP